jgi:hypothetical protein
MLTHSEMETLAGMVADLVVAKTATDRWMKIKDACSYANLSKPIIEKCIKAGAIKAKKRPIGGWVVDRLSIDEYNGSE